MGEEGLAGGGSGGTIYSGAGDEGSGMTHTELELNALSHHGDNNNNSNDDDENDIHSSSGYEQLLMDVVRGRQNLFVSPEELKEVERDGGVCCV